MSVNFDAFKTPSGKMNPFTFGGGANDGDPAMRDRVTASMGDFKGTVNVLGAMGVQPGQNVFNA